MFRLDAGSGVPIYRQLVEQVRRDVMLGRLRPGDQLPSVKEVVDSLSVNPNTVVKAFSELEHQGLVVRRQGVGTFVAASPSGDVRFRPRRGCWARWPAGWTGPGRTGCLPSRSGCSWRSPSMSRPAARMTAGPRAVSHELGAAVCRPRAPLRPRHLGPA